MATVLALQCSILYLVKDRENIEPTWIANITKECHNYDRSKFFLKATPNHISLTLYGYLTYVTLVCTLQYGLDFK